MSQLKCIYPIPPVGSTVGHPCLLTPDQLQGNAQNDLVRMQRHLRDVHLRCSTPRLQEYLRGTIRWVFRGVGTPEPEITVLKAGDPWVDEPYIKVQYCLPDGTPWLESLPSEAERRRWMLRAHEAATKALPELMARRADLLTELGVVDREIAAATRDVVVLHEERDGGGAISHHADGSTTYWLPEPVAEPVQ